MDSAKWTQKTASRDEKKSREGEYVRQEYESMRENENERMRDRFAPNPPLFP